MSHQQQVGVADIVVADGQPTEDELVPSQTEGYKVGPGETKLIAGWPAAISSRACRARQGMPLAGSS
jgi:hypothetical protein